MMLTPMVNGRMMMLRLGGASVEMWTLNVHRRLRYETEFDVKGIENAQLM